VRDGDGRNGGGVDVGRRGGGGIARSRAFLGFPLKFSLKLLTILFEVGAAAESTEAVVLAILFFRIRQRGMRSRGGRSGAGGNGVARTGGIARAARGGRGVVTGLLLLRGTGVRRGGEPGVLGLGRSRGSFLCRFVEIVLYLVKLNGLLDQLVEGVDCDKSETPLDIFLELPFVHENLGIVINLEDLGQRLEFGGEVTGGTLLLQSFEFAPALVEEVGVFVEGIHFSTEKVPIVEKGVIGVGASKGVGPRCRAPTETGNGEGDFILVTVQEDGGLVFEVEFAVTDEGEVFRSLAIKLRWEVNLDVLEGKRGRRRGWPFRDLATASRSRSLLWAVARWCRAVRAATSTFCPEGIEFGLEATVGFLQLGFREAGHRDRLGEGSG
jgi:hypothetical protein